MFSGRGTPSRQLHWAIEVDIASLSLEPERRDRKFSRQNLEQDDADIQRALRKKSRKVKGDKNQNLQSFHNFHLSRFPGKESGW